MKYLNYGAKIVSEMDPKVETQPASDKWDGI